MKKKAQKGLPQSRNNQIRWFFSNPQLLGVAFRANLAGSGDFLHQAISAVIWCTVLVKCSVGMGFIVQTGFSLMKEERRVQM